MGKSTKIIIALVAAAVIAIGWIVLSGDKSDNKNTDTAPTGDNQTQTPETAETIIYTDTGFSPAEITVASGTSVTITNDSAEEIEPSSNPHPIHTDNPELNVGDILPGESKTFTVTTHGSWGYHNHYNKDHGGTIIVE